MQTSYHQRKYTQNIIRNTFKTPPVVEKTHVGLSDFPSFAANAACQSVSLSPFSAGFMLNRCDSYSSDQSGLV